MIVFAWFTVIGFVILVGFGLLIATFVHWFKEWRKKQQNT